MEEPEKSPALMSLVMRFFTIPLIIVVLCVGVFYFFGKIAYDKKTIDDYLNEIKTGSSSRRWQAAYELSKRINQVRLKGEQGEKIALDLAKVYRKEKNEEDPRLRRYVILGLTGLSTPGSLSLYKEALSDTDTDVRIYAIWGIGTLKDPKTVKLLLPYLEDQDPAFRKMAAYSLGVVANQKARPALRKALKDNVPDVQWNAALALAQMDDDSGKVILHQMLDESYLDQMGEINETQKFEIMENAMKGVLLIEDRSALPFLNKLLEAEAQPPFIEQVRKTIDRLE